MRILANYGYKTNGDAYTVTFETMGDVPPTHAPQTVDELFRLSKEAVQRQVRGAVSTTAPSDHGHAAPPAPPAPMQPPQTSTERPKANGWPARTTGNGRKPQIKDPGLPATKNQLGLINRLALQTGRPVADLTDITKGDASAKIKELLAV